MQNVQQTTTFEPIPCRCGGKPLINVEPDVSKRGRFWVCCDTTECDVETDLFHTRAEAVRAWNKHPSGAYIH